MKKSATPRGSQTPSRYPDEDFPRDSDPATDTVRGEANDEDASIEKESGGAPKKQRTSRGEGG